MSAGLDRPTRIAVVTPHQTGAGTPLASLWYAARDCRARGIELLFLNTRGLGDLDRLQSADRVIFDTISVLRHHWGPAYYLAALRSGKPRAVYYHETGWNLRAATTLVPTWTGPVPIPVAVHHALRHPRTVHFSVCESGVRALVQQYGVDATRTHVLNNIADSRSLTARALPLTSEAGLSVIAGKACERKGTDLLLQIARLVKQEDPSQRFLWLGGFGGGRYSRSALEEETVRLGISEQVRFLGYRDDAADVMAGAERVLSVSRDDPMPKVLMEALALGKHAIAFDVGGIRDLLGVHGEVVPEGDVEAFARALLAGPPDQREATQRARRDYFESRFTAAAFARRFAEALDWWARLDP